MLYVISYYTYEYLSADSIFKTLNRGNIIYNRELKILKKNNVELTQLTHHPCRQETKYQVYRSDASQNKAQESLHPQYHSQLFPTPIKNTKIEHNCRNHKNAQMLQLINCNFALILL